MGFQEFWDRWWRFIFIVFTPFLLAFVFFIEEPNNNCSETDPVTGACIGKTNLAAYIYILLWMGTYWVTNCIDMTATSLMPIILMPMFGVLGAKDVAPNYMKDIALLFLGGLLFAAAIEKTGLHRRLALTVMKIFGAKPHALMAGFQICTWFLSMWISNTATTAMVMPIAESVFQVIEAQEKRRYERQGREWKGPSAGIRKLFVGLTLAIPHSANIGGMATVTGTPPNKILVGHLEDNYPCMKPNTVDFGLWMAYAFPQSVLYMILAYFWLSTYYIGWFGNVFCKGKIQPREDLAQVGETEEDLKEIEAVINDEYEKLGPITKKLGEMIVSGLFVVLVLLWFFRAPAFGGFQHWFESGYVTDSTVVMFVSGFLFILPNDFPKFSTKKQKQPTKPILTWDECTIPWGVIILIGGGYALSAGSKASGFGDMIKNAMVGLKGVAPWTVAFVITVIVGFATEFTSNTATESLLVSIVSETAVAIEINPLFLLMPMTLATSLAFMLPIATPPNAIAFSYGRLTVRDMITSGAIMNVVGFALVVILVNTYGRAVFGSKQDPFNDTHFPQWANASVVGVNRDNCAAMVGY